MSIQGVEFMLCYYCMREKNDNAECPYCHHSGAPEPDPHLLLPGTVLRDRYIIGQKLGEGGFGITYIGYDKVFEIRVAIKEYFPYGHSQRNHTAADTVSIVGEADVFEKGKQRFLQEAKTLVKYRREPGIVEVTDFVEANNTAYIIMEYLEGVNLRAYLKQNGVMTADRAFGMLTPVMESLEKIHRTGIIHRDISPENIMVMSDGSLKLMDFGAARDYESDDKSLSVILKHGYAPEEQYRRRGEQGPWTDVYAMCATIYRCITDRTPAESVDRLYRDSLQRPSALGANISPALENVLMYGMAVRKEERCPDMQTLLKMVKDATAGKYIPPISQPIQRPARDEYATVALNGEKTVYMNRQPVQAPVYPVNTQDQYSVTPPPEAPKKKGNGTKIAVILLICAIALGVIAGVVLIVQNASSGSLVSDNTNKTRLKDSAGVLSMEERSTLSDKMDTASKKHKFDIAAVVVSSLDGKSDRNYAEEYFDTNELGYGQNADGVLLLYAKKEHRMYICTSGSATDLLPRSYVDSILSTVQDSFSEKEYYTGIDQYIEMVEKRLK